MSIVCLLLFCLASVWGENNLKKCMRFGLKVKIAIEKKEPRAKSECVHERECEIMV